MDEINEALGTDIDWEWMDEDELEELKEDIDSGEVLQSLITHMIKQESKEKVDQVIDKAADGYYPGKYIRERLL